MQVMVCATWLRETSPQFLDGSWIGMLRLVVRTMVGEDRAIRFDVEFPPGKSACAVYRLAVASKAGAEKTMNLPLFASLASGFKDRPLPPAEDIQFAKSEILRMARTFRSPRIAVEAIGSALGPLAAALARVAGESTALMICAGLAKSILEIEAADAQASEIVVDNAAIQGSQAGGKEATPIALGSLIARVGRVRANGSSAADIILAA
jgi:hypothetical protein